MVTFKIDTDIVYGNFVFVDKYIFIQGDSGSGKSAFISEVSDTIKLGGIGIECDLPYYLVSSKDELSNMKQVIDSGITAVFISDEFLGYKVLEIAKNKNAYCIIVTRNLHKNINASYKSIYIASNESGRTLLNLR
jgi:hypothetical protein